MPKIKDITCHKVLNSRSEWTIETRVELDDGAVGTQTVPDGASTGENEALHLEAQKAAAVVNDPLKDLLVSKNPFNQLEIDTLMIDMDGTPNKRVLGGNSILSVSLAVSNAAAKSLNLQLFEYLHVLYKNNSVFKPAYSKMGSINFPTPVFNILNGGKHADNDLSFQEFMVIPAKTTPYPKQLEMGVFVYNSLHKLLVSQGYESGVGDEGGFAPQGFTTKKALTTIKQAVEEVRVDGEKNNRLVLGKDLFLGMDVAAESFHVGDRYEIKEESLKLDHAQLSSYYGDLLQQYPIIYLEDPFYENDIEGWEHFYQNYKQKVMIVADDLVVTNAKYLKAAIKKNLASAVIIKPNQVGTVSETLDFIRLAKSADMSTIVSHRSGDTPEDTFISDLAVAVEADFIKSGSPARGERVAKYNRLLDIFDNFFGS
ncbi:phosphopyruvate hydratase [Candidatus Nomurabacteria bacterium]|uniref:Enolase n=1 Tax=candidate division WWE3 bacterium TaxID=2053526 RepID=A0A955DZP1_UNCKA|nr:phosphopyruvate hydratase [candidate division WWE3 bacterium]MCB9824110.1 phosphopyruvate hydratase [Candidatus Nomurabacteria bacterium]MCB9826919.1 phosphopyruvate hydratase [Candidatus Nomurabacteria bacterium]MCB9828051.1 phosphopyruvate hydratase [Candidatus Nomurabacteria bacterium]HXK52783.1 phosphopyruvate hydratase [bacterium]